MRLQAKLLQAARRGFDPNRLTTLDVTKLTARDLTYLNSHWRMGSDDGEFVRVKLIKSWPKTELQPYAAARYLVLCGVSPEADEDDEGTLGFVEAREEEDGSLSLEADYKAYKNFPTYEEALMAFATYGLE